MVHAVFHGSSVNAFIFGVAGGLFLYPFLMYPALIGYTLLVIGGLIAVLIFAVRNPNM